MASSRELSPASSDGASYSQVLLTPNSKIKALLATLDDSDHEPFEVSARDRLLAEMAKTTSRKPDTASVSKEINANGEEHTDEDPFIQPATQITAKIQRNLEYEDSDLMAQNRVKSTRISPRPKIRSGHNASASDDSDEGIIPVTLKRRKNRIQNHLTPKSSTRKSLSPSSLFVSPQKPSSPHSYIALPDSKAQTEEPSKNQRLLALIRRKKAERLIIDEETARNEEDKALERNKNQTFVDHEEESDESNEDTGLKFTHRSLSIRKASKRALEEINRETQRISRNQQLAHKEITKKKITKSSLFSRFNYNPKCESENIRPLSSSSATLSTDVGTHDSPPTSPIPTQSIELHVAQPIQSILDINVNDQNTCNNLAGPKGTSIGSLGSSQVNAKEGNQVTELHSKPEKKLNFVPKAINPGIIKSAKLLNINVSTIDDSDSDLEITEKTPTLKKRINDVFDRVPAKQAKETTALHVLKMLAQLSSPPSKKGSTKNSGVTNAELQISLQQRARQQAIRENEERLELLKAKGIIIQTSEEIEKEQSELDDMLSKARAEAQKLAKREKIATDEQKNQSEPGLIDDSSADEDYTEVEKISDDRISLSGSDEESEDNLDEDECEFLNKEKEDTKILHGVDNDRATAKPILKNSGESDIDEDMDLKLPAFQRRQNHRKLNVISDDEDEFCHEVKTPSLSSVGSPQNPQAQTLAAPGSVLRSATKSFIPGLPVSGPAGLGLTQIFTGTLDESQLSSTVFSQEQGTSQASLDSSRRQPPPTFELSMPIIEKFTQLADTTNPSQASRIPDSQSINPTPQYVQSYLSESGVNLLGIPNQENPLSQFPELTQDSGFAQLTPIGTRFIDEPASTAGTIMSQLTEENNITKKKKRLRRRIINTLCPLDEGETKNIPVVSRQDEISNIQENIQEEVRRSSKVKGRAANNFDKKQSVARELFNEQADESEDEYAGLGGASDEETGSDEDQDMKDMIDDEGGKDVNERELAAFFADRERANDEKQIEKLYKDITKGMLRRRRGADYDLSDSDDGGEARQRRKRKEFAKMRKALLADERISKIATNPKNQAFLRAIEDQGSEDEIYFLHDLEEPGTTIDPLPHNQSEVTSDSPASMSPPKRKFSGTLQAEQRSAPHLRRTKCVRTPSNLSEIRESLSSLIEDPRSLSLINNCPDSDDDLEIIGSDLACGPEKNKDKDLDPFAPRKNPIPIIDRISLKRTSTLATSSNTRFAFAPSDLGTGFLIPPLLRRAKTNSSVTSGSSSASNSIGVTASTEREAGPPISGMKRGGTKGSGLNFFARENERRAKIIKTEKRREQKLIAGAMYRQRAVDGLLGRGKFE